MVDEEWDLEDDDECDQEYLDYMQNDLHYMEEIYEAPVQMTHEQYNYFILDDYTDSLVRLLKGNRNLKADFDEDFWSPLSERDVVRAWLNPSVVRIEED